MIARHNRERRLAGDQGEALMGLRHLHRFHFFGRGEVRVHDRIRYTLEAARFMFFIHGQRLVLPDIAQRGDKGDLTAFGFQIVGDELHLLQEHLVRIEGEALRGLVRVVEIVLGIRQDSDREFRVYRRRPNRRSDRTGTGGRKTGNGKQGGRHHRTRRKK